MRVVVQQKLGFCWCDSMSLLKIIYYLKPAWASACGYVSQQAVSGFSGKLWMPMVISKWTCLDAMKQAVLTTSSCDEPRQAVRHWVECKKASTSYHKF